MTFTLWSYLKSEKSLEKCRLKIEKNKKRLKNVVILPFSYSQCFNTPLMLKKGMKNYVTWLD